MKIKIIAIILLLTFLVSNASAACSGTSTCTKTTSCSTCPTTKTCSTCPTAKTCTSYTASKSCTTCVVPNFGATTAGSKYAVKFKDTSTCKPTGWSWNFGDGYRSSVQNPEHKYAKAGSYRVCLSIKVGNSWCPTPTCKTVIVK
jgi:PKD repeat protein